MRKTHNLGDKWSPDRGIGCGGGGGGSSESKLALFHFVSLKEEDEGQRRARAAIGRHDGASKGQRSGLL